MQMLPWSIFIDGDCTLGESDTLEIASASINLEAIPTFGVYT